jgi:hypothetical protein
MLFLAILGVTEQPASLDSYVLRFGSSTTMSGDSDVDGLGRLQERYGARFFWFKRDGQAYVVSDAKQIERAMAIVRPQRELGEKQAALGQKQAALGEKQAALGQKQAAIGMRQAGSWRDDELREQLSREQEALSRQQDALGAQQEVLGHQQEKLGAEQERISGQVEQQLSDLADECIRKGVAKKV